MTTGIKQLLKRTILFEAYKKFCIWEGRHYPVLQAKRMFRMYFKRILDLNNPQLFAEKIIWLKLFYFPKDSLTVLAGDKYGLRQYLDKKELSHLKAPIIGTYDSVGEINWKTLPNKFVIKKSNASGYNIVVTDKNKVSEKDVKRKIGKWMNTPFGYLTGQHHYEKMRPKIVVEEFIEEIGKEWRILCFNGRPEIVQMVHWLGEYDGSVHGGHLESGLVFADLEGKIVGIAKSINHSINQSINQRYKVGDNIDLPSDFKTMVETAVLIAKDFPFVRVDFFHGGGKLILSELTFTPANGYGRYGDSLQRSLGEKLTLPKRK